MRITIWLFENVNSAAREVETKKRTNRIDEVFFPTALKVLLKALVRRAENRNGSRVQISLKASWKCYENILTIAFSWPDPERFINSSSPKGRKVKMNVEFNFAESVKKVFWKQRSDDPHLGLRAIPSIAQQ